MRSFVVQRFSIPDNAVHVDHEGLVGRHDFVFTYVTEFRCAIPIRCFHPNDLPVYAAFIDLAHIARVGEGRSIFVNVRYCYMNCGAVKEINKSENKANIFVNLNRFKIHTAYQKVTLVFVDDQCRRKNCKLTSISELFFPIQLII